MKNFTQNYVYRVKHDLYNITGLTFIPSIIDLNKRIRVKQNLLDIYNIVNINKSPSKNIKQRYDIVSCSEHYKFQDFIHGVDTFNFRYLIDSVSRGHDMFYFSDYKNIPSFIKDTLLTKIINDNNINFKNVNCAVNFYRQINGIQTGLKWHTDLDFHGDCISIYSLYGNATIDFSENKTHIFPICFNENSLIIINDDARWKYEHRVSELKTNNKNTISRISITFGFSNEKITNKHIM